MMDLAREARPTEPHPGAKLGRLATEWALHPPPELWASQMRCCVATHHSPLYHCSPQSPHLTVIQPASHEDTQQVLQ